MQNTRLIIILLFIFNTILVFGQCEYTLDNLSHNECYGTSNGSISISLNNGASVSWTGPNGFSSSNSSLINLYAGTYYLTITNSIWSCTLLDSIDIEETIQLSADFDLIGMCSEQDSVDVVANLWGGTPPYSTIWSNGDPGPNVTNLPSSPWPYVLTITDDNYCTESVNLWVREVKELNPFMSSVGAVCKDDNSGEARVFIEGGTPPFIFNWRIHDEIYQEDDILIVDSFSSIIGLSPGFYSVEITDDMGCVISDSIEVKSNPDICLTVYKAFSPNDDNVHEFWEINNIHLYSEAVVSVYDRNGGQVFRRRNYTNSEDDAFGGKDVDGQPLPSGTYYYIIDLQNEDKVFKGTVTIVR